MKGLRISILVAFAVFVVICILKAPTEGERTIRELQRRELLRMEGGELVKSSLEFLTKGSKFERHWRINDTPSKDCLNVYILKSRLAGDAGLSPQIRKLLGNAGYLGTPNIIVIDPDFIRDFPQRFGLFAYARSESTTNQIRAALLTWVLGHEIGHIICGHSPAHFATDRLADESPTQSLRRTQELDADTTFAKVLESSPEQRLTVERLLLDLINFEIKSKLGIVPQGVMILYDYKDKRVVHYKELGSHPEFILRGTRLLQITSKAQGSKALAYEVTQFSKLLQPETQD